MNLLAQWEAADFFSRAVTAPSIIGANSPTSSRDVTLSLGKGCSEMSQFDALIDDLDRFQKWEARKARKAAVPPQARLAPAPGRAMPARPMAKAMDSLIAEADALRAETAQQNARLRAQNADAKRQRGFATLDAVMSKAMAGVAQGRLTALEAITIDRRCAAIAARLHAQERAEKAGKAGR